MSVVVSYKYKGIHLKGQIVQELIIELFNKKTVARKNIISETKNTHIERGGLDPSAADYSRVVKKALADLQKRKIAQRVSHAMWRIDADNKAVGISSQKKNSKESPKIKSVKTIGKGKEAVYCYYYSTYKILANKEGKNVWPCKIGKATVDTVSRILSQSTTSLPEYPILALQIKSDDSSGLEKAIHSILDYRKRRLVNSPGKEWFDTNPDEIHEIFESTF